MKNPSSLTVRQAIALESRSGWESNARMVAAACPIEFFAEKNDWAKAASRLYGSVDTSKWEWKTADPKVQEIELLAVRSLLASFWLSLEQKLAVGGWMLSEMLSETP